MFFLTQITERSSGGSSSVTVSAVPIKIHRFDVRNLLKIGCRSTQLSRSSVISVVFHQRADFCFCFYVKFGEFSGSS